MSEKNKKRIRVRSKTRKVVTKNKRLGLLDRKAVKAVKQKTFGAIAAEAAAVGATPWGSAPAAASTPRGSAKAAVGATPRGKQPKGQTKGYRKPTQWNRQSQVLNLRLKTDVFRRLIDLANQAESFPGTYAAGILTEHLERLSTNNRPALEKIARVGRTLKRVLKGGSKPKPTKKPRIRSKKKGGRSR